MRVLRVVVFRLLGGSAIYDRCPATTFQAVHSTSMPE